MQGGVTNPAKQSASHKFYSKNFLEQSNYYQFPFIVPEKLVGLVGKIDSGRQRGQGRSGLSDVFLCSVLLLKSQFLKQAEMRAVIKLTRTHFCFYYSPCAENNHIYRNA